MNEGLRKRIANLEERTENAGKAEAMRKCYDEFFDDGQIAEATIKAAGQFGKQFTILFGLEKCEDGYYRPRRKETAA